MSLASDIEQLKSKASQKAVQKFGDISETIVYNQEGYEQASRWQVAKYHAQYFLDNQIKCVVDLTCSIGIDALYMAKAGLKVVAFEIDQKKYQMATKNLSGFENVDVYLMDSTSREAQEIMLRSGVEGIFADPARRSNGRRIYKTDDYLPSLEKIFQVRDELNSKLLLIKMGTTIERGDNLEFISVDGDLVEGLYVEQKNEENSRVRSVTAVAITSEGDVTKLRSSDIEPFADNITPPTIVSKEESKEEHRNQELLENKVLIEPDSAVIRSGLVEKYASHIKTSVISEGIAYLIGVEESVSLADSKRFKFRAYYIEKVLKHNLKQIVDYLSQNKFILESVKKRGVDIDPHLILKKINTKVTKMTGNLPGVEKKVLILTRYNKDHVALVVKPHTF